MNLASEVAKRLLQIKAIKLSPQNPFTWASGIKSPIYCDNRIVLSYPEAREVVKAGLVEKSKEYGDFDVIAGVATAGIAHGMMLADALDKPFIYVRGSAKGHGRQNLIEGELPQDKSVLVIEDLISTGGSSIKAIQALRDNGANVVGCMAIFTYGFQKAVDAFANADCKFSTLSNYDELIKEAIDSQYITQADMDFLVNWRAEIGSK